MKKIDDGQLKIAPNGNIMPCPFQGECKTYGIGCNGLSYWCRKDFKSLNPKEKTK